MGVVIMKWNRLLLFALTSLVAACEIPETRKNLRTAHMPIFAEIAPKKQSSANPYWVRFSAINDEQSMRLSNGAILTPENPTLIGTLGTHYRFPSDYYAYIMTGGIGVQRDYTISDSSKLAWGAFVGIDSAWGLQAIHSTRVGEWFGAPLKLYSSLQYRQTDSLLQCKTIKGLKCKEPDASAQNKVRFRNQVLDPIIGLELGTIKIGEKGNTTLFVQTEFGYRIVLDRKQTEEKFSPSDYEQNDEQPFISVLVGGSLW